MDRLDALRIKYARAQEHRAAWSRALDKWVATTPYGIRGEADPSGWFVSRLVAREPPPPERSLTFADMISNLRATLDHIIWALLEESGNATHGQLTFPCVLERKDWRSARGSKLRNVPPQWIPAIEQAQPFTAHQPRRHPSAASAPDVRSASVGHHDQAPLVDPDRAEHIRVGGDL